MENLSNIPNLEENENILNNENGQTFIEFVLLLMIIMGISFGYMRVVNGGIANYWESMGNILMKDVPNGKKLKLR